MYFLFCFETFHLFNWPSPMPVPKRKINCSQPELLAHNILYLMFGRQWFLLLELKIIFLQNNISFKVRIRWTGKNSKQKKLQRSLCEVREKFCTVNPESREMATKILLLDTPATCSCVLVLDVATQLVTWQGCIGNRNLVKRKTKNCFL